MLNKKFTVEFKGKTYEFGTERKRTKLDAILDEYVLERYYESHDEAKTSERDKEILSKTYLKSKKS